MLVVTRAGCRAALFLWIFISISCRARTALPASQSQNHRITESAELEGTHKDHRVQLLALHKTPQESHHVPDSIDQTLLELCQAGAGTPPMGSLFSAQPPSGGRTFA